MRPAPQDASDVEQLNMTPMIDCVFQLLIFFMCATHFKTLEAKMSAFLPREVGPGEAGARALPREIRVRIVYDGGAAASRFVVGGAEVPGGGLGRTLQDLAARLRAGGPPDRRVSVKIDAAGDVPFQDAVFVMDESRRNNLPDVEYAASPSGVR